MACANEECTNAGTLLCGRCASVSYCSPACQKTHWAKHKATCKSKAKEDGANSPSISSSISSSSSPSSSAKGTVVTNLSPQVVQELNSLKKSFLDALRLQKFTEVINISTKFLPMLDKLPSPDKNIEKIQLHLNLSQVYTQIENVHEAGMSADKCLEEAEAAFTANPENITTLELLVAALKCKSVYYLNVGSHTMSIELSFRAHEEFSKRLPKDDVRFSLTLRHLAMVHEKQNVCDKAWEYIEKAYGLLFKSLGPYNKEVSTCLAECILILTRLQKLPEALELTKVNLAALMKLKFDEIVDKEKYSQHQILVADINMRISSILINMKQFDDGLSYIKRGYTIREKVFGKDHSIIAYTLLGMAKVMEDQGNYSDEPIVLLEKAIDIFKKNPSDNPSYHIKNCHAVMQNILNKRDGKPAVSIASNDSNADVEINMNIVNREIESLEKDDAIRRMILGQKLFHLKKFNLVEILLKEAIEIFKNDPKIGPDHQHTKEATQNLMIVRVNLTRSYWEDLVDDEVRASAAIDASTSGSITGNTTGSTTSSTVGSAGSASSKPIESFASFEVEKPEKNSCIIC